jgi:hypothetical protein
LRLAGTGGFFQDLSEDCATLLQSIAMLAIGAVAVPHICSSALKRR